MSTKKKTTAPELMVVNDLPGEECRIAILQNNHLEELYTERTATATNVGNIYKGRVTNVEPAIQAAFVDYGEGQAGFLHISDLHPQYFPGAKRTERVGKKIPRRSRPPIQEALKRGDEVLVQVLKEGIGTKGPTLTSYLSVPGRFLVMMPDMDRVGVSRKVEDLDARREMRKTLDTLKLPEGFGFILRTAGLGETKTELNRDVAYLTRLWKVMDKRRSEVGAPCELYTESDLFVRTIRDILRPTIETIVVDSEQAHERAQALLRVVAPRSAPRLIRYRDRVPIFHAFDIERQIDLIHSREVPLPSGGKLVIDQTEALVAIDVNSGRSRRARDSETNAFATNCEAVDEICRQLRLRDLGGLVINDLIDMHAQRHRREIEDRMRAGLSRDRARTTMLRISEFGIVELTRQRMRPSLRKSHFMDCSHCAGHGEIKTPESVGSDATRHLGFLLQFERIRRLEVVCSPRVASVLLSSKRRELVAMEDGSGKKIDVRVSDAITVDRVDYYAYDERSADIDLTKLPPARVPSLDELDAATEAPAAAAAAPRSKRRRRRRGSKPADAGDLMLAGGDDLAAEQDDQDDRRAAKPAAEPDKAAAEDGKPRRRRSRRRSRSGRTAGATAAADAAKAAQPAEPDASSEPAEPAEHAVPAEAAEPQEPQPAIRVHQLASELGVSSKEVITRCREDEVLEVKSHMSSLPARAADLVRMCFGMKKKKGAEAEDRPEPAAGTPPQTEPEQQRREQPEAPVSKAPDTPEAAPDADDADQPTDKPATSEPARLSASAKRRRRRRAARERAAANGAATPGDGEQSEEPAAARPEKSQRPATSTRRSGRSRRKKKTAGSGRGAPTEVGADTTSDTQPEMSAAEPAAASVPPSREALPEADPPEAPPARPARNDDDAPADAQAESPPRRRGKSSLYRSRRTIARQTLPVDD